MKTKILAGVISAILLTASVVVGFFQHAAFVTQKSNHRGSRYSLSQVGLSATNSGVDDLSSLLQTAKSELGMSATNSASTIGDVSGSAKTAAVVNTPSNGILKATQATLQQTGPVVTVDEGKALPLSSYIKASANGNAPSGPTISSWSNTQEKLELMKSNTIRLSGRDPSEFPEIKFPDFSAPDFPKLPDTGSLDFHSIQQFIDNLPPVAKTWAAVAAGTALIIIGASNSKKTAPKREATAVASSEDIQSRSDAIDGLTDELRTLRSRMKAIEATGLELDNQLKDAKSKLTQKELDISKAKLQAADASLSLNREIDSLKQKLKDNDGKVNTLDEELDKAREECENLVEELEKSREEQVKNVVAEPTTLENPVEVAKKQKAEESEKEKKIFETSMKKQALELAKKKQAATKTVRKKVVLKSTSEDLPTAETPLTKKTTPRKVSVERSAPKKIASTSKVEEKASGSGVRTSGQELPSATPVKKVTRTKAAAKKGDLTTLSKSALNRTTVNVLVEFLESKGIATSDENGKTLKKALLLEAVRSL